MNFGKHVDICIERHLEIFSWPIGQKLSLGEIKEYVSICSYIPLPIPQYVSSYKHNVGIIMFISVFSLFKMVDAIKTIAEQL